MVSYRKIKLINKSRQDLQVKFRDPTTGALEKLTIRRKKNLRLIPGIYEFKLYYKNASVMLANSSDLIEYSSVASPDDDRFVAVNLKVDCSSKHAKIYCEDKISVVSILQQVK